MFLLMPMMGLSGRWVGGGDGGGHVMIVKCARWNCWRPLVWSLQFRPANQEVVKRSISKWGVGGGGCIADGRLALLHFCIPFFLPPSLPICCMIVGERDKAEKGNTVFTASSSGCQRKTQANETLRWRQQQQQLLQAHFLSRLPALRIHPAACLTIRCTTCHCRPVRFFFWLCV